MRSLICAGLISSQIVLQRVWQRTHEQYKSIPEQFRTLFTMFRSPNRQQTGSLAGKHSLSSEWGRSLWRGCPGRQRADRERTEAKFKDRRQVRWLGQRRGDVVRDRSHLRYQEIRLEQNTGEYIITWQQSGKEWVWRSWLKGGWVSDCRAGESDDLNEAP